MLSRCQDQCAAEGREDAQGKGKGKASAVLPRRRSEVEAIESDGDSSAPMQVSDFCRFDGHTGRILSFRSLHNTVFNPYVVCDHVE